MKLTPHEITVLLATALGSHVTRCLKRGWSREDVKKGVKVRVREDVKSRYGVKPQQRTIHGVVIEETSLGIAVRVRTTAREDIWIDMEHLEIDK